jgi:hypothetical protein
MTSANLNFHISLELQEYFQHSDVSCHCCTMYGSLASSLCIDLQIQQHNTIHNEVTSTHYVYPPEILNGSKGGINKQQKTICVQYKSQYYAKN